MLKNCLLSSAVVAVLVLGCTKQKPKDEQMVLRVAFSDPVESLDPALSYNLGTWQLLSLVYETLFQYSYLSDPYEIEPLLAADIPSFSEDRTQVTIRIRRDARYPDDPAFVDTNGKGRTLAARDFIFGIQRLALPELDSPGWWLLKEKIVGFKELREKLAKADAKKRAELLNTPVPGLSAPDDHTLVIRLTQAYPNFLYLLTLPFTAPIPREIVDHYGDKKETLQEKAIGTGPFQIQFWRMNKKAVLVRSERTHANFFPTRGADEFKDKGFLKDSGKALPFVDKIEISLGGSATELAEKYRQGKTDVVESLYNRDLKKDPPLIVKEPATSEFIVLNMDKHIIRANRFLRQAISSAIDRNGYVKLLPSDLAIKQTQVLPPGVSGHADSRLKFDFDPKKTLVLLEKAGYPKGKGLPPLTLITRGNDSLVRKKADFLIQAFDAVGIPIQVVLTSVPEFLARKKSGEFHLALEGWTMDYPDAENFFHLLQGQNPSNAARFQSQEFDQLFERMRSIENSAKRKELIRRLDDVVQTEVPWVLLSYQSSFAFKRDQVKNLRATDLVVNKYKYIRVEKK